MCFEVLDVEIRYKYVVLIIIGRDRKGCVANEYSKGPSESRIP